MNTQKRVNERINNIALKNQKVELGAIDDLKKKLDKNISNLDSAISKVRGMAKNFVDLEEDFGKISNEVSLIRKQLSDLGIDDPKDLGYISLKAKEMEKLSREFIKSLR
jgi:DNA repair ATPase RecN